jgi:glycosyltransferase involved in cell wall biosynthesis
MDRATVTPLLITFNEIQNIERTLTKLDWAARVVVVDSGSTDGTLDVLAKDPRIEVVQRPFDSFADQCNFGLTHIRTDWVLSLDADYELSDAFVAELADLEPAPEVAGYKAAFVYRIHGHPLRAALYPPRAVLYRVDGALYENEGHGHRIRLQGRLLALKGAIYHDDRKPLSRWLDSQLRYAAREAAHLLETPRERLGRIDRIRLMGWPAPILVLGYVLFAKGVILDGKAGWFYAFQRLLAEVLLALELLDRRLSAVSSKGGEPR